MLTEVHQSIDLVQTIPMARQVTELPSVLSPRNTAAIHGGTRLAPLDPAAPAFEDLELQPTSSTEWSEEFLVYLHWRLLQDLNGLANPETPLEEKFSTLRWVFTERDKDIKPFSFVSCLRVVGCSPLSPIPYCGLVDAEEIRDRIQTCLPQWMQATLMRYPDWVQEAIRQSPDWIDTQLDSNPQWLNEQLKRVSTQGDLFVA